MGIGWASVVDAQMSSLAVTLAGGCERARDLMKSERLDEQKEEEKATNGQYGRMVNGG